MGSIARMDRKLPPKRGTCPVLPLQLLARNPFSQSDRPGPPLTDIRIFLKADRAIPDIKKRQIHLTISKLRHRS